MERLDEMLAAYKSAVFSTKPATARAVTELTMHADDELVGECSDFIRKAPPEVWERMTAAEVGRDFFLTRNDDTAGFTTRGLGELGEALRVLAIGFPVVTVCVTDNGLIEFR